MRGIIDAARAGLSLVSLARLVRRVSPALLAAAFGSLAHGAAGPATVYWDTTSGNGVGGTGNWTGGSTWNSNSNGKDNSLSAWSDGSIAVFQGVAGNVTVNSNVSVNSLVFGVTGYTILGTANLSLGAATTDINTSTFDASISAPLAGTNALSKSGSGTLTLSGANTYSGKTSINEGTLSVTTLNSVSGGSASSSLGAPTTVANGTIDLGASTTTGTLAITGSTNQVTDRVINLAGTTGGGTIDASGTGTLQFTSNLTATGAGAKTFTLQGSSTAGNSFSGAIVNGAGTTSLTKAGTGTWTLDGSFSNTFTGTTSITSGTLVLSKTNGATAISSTIAIGSGSGSATLQLGAANQIPSGAAVSFNNTGGAPTLDLNGFSQTVGSIATTNTGASILLGSPAAATSFVVGDGTSTTYAGTISGGANASFTKQNTGTLTLTGNNTFTGNTTVAGGTLLLNRSGGTALASGNVTIGDGTGTDTLQLGAASQLISTAAVTFASGGSPVLNLGGFSQTLGSISSSNASAQIQLGSPASTTTFAFGDSTSTTYAGTFTGGANATVTKQGSGTVTLSGSSSNTGAVTISAGTLKLQNSNALGTGTAGVTVNSGATLQLDGSTADLTVAKGTLTLAGTGSGSGALIQSAGSNKWQGNVTLSGNTTINAGTVASTTLTLGDVSPTYYRVVNGNPNPSPPTDTNTLALGSNTLTLLGGANTTLQINSQITGTGNVDINTSGLVRFFANQNTFTGTTTVKNGTLSIETLNNTFPGDTTYPNYFGLNGPLVIGDGTGAAGSALVQLPAGTNGQELLNYTKGITLYSDGKLYLPTTQSIDTLTFNGGTIDVSTGGGLYLNNTVTVNASAGNTATITGTGGALSLTIHNGDSSVTNRVFNVIGGVGNQSDLTISAIINNGSLTKTGAGTLTISGDNSTGYGGTTTINNGILAITNATALGQATNIDANGTTVNSGGTLQLQNNISVSAEKLTLNGSGFSGNGGGTGVGNATVSNIGALQNLSGNNTWAGAITLGSDSRMQSDANLLTISGSITSAVNGNLNVGGSGNTTISGAIGTGSGGLSKDGSGTLILSGANTYTGATSVNAGVLSLQSNTGLGSASGSTTVASGATLELNNAASGNLTTLAEPLALNGTGVSGAGALRNAAGNNTFAGQVTLSSASLITAADGTTLTLSGGTTSANQQLTVGQSSGYNGNVTISGNMSNGTGALVKNGTGALTFSGSTGAVGNVSLNAGTMNVGTGSASALSATKFDSASSTTLTVATGGSVTLAQAAGVTSTFSGSMAGNGTFTFNGANSTSTLVFNHSGGFNASGLTLNIGGGTLSLLNTNGAGTSNFQFGTIHITGNTVLDFNNSAGTFLTSANLIIDAGVTVTVNNWVSVANTTNASTIWYATNQTNGVQGSTGNLTLTNGTVSGTNPLNQITFTNYNNMTTTWVSGTTNGWFDREIRPTPEPATYGVIFLSGCLGLLGWRRYQRGKHARS